MLVESEARPRREVLFASSVLFLGTGLVRERRLMKPTLQLQITSLFSLSFTLSGHWTPFYSRRKRLPRTQPVKVWDALIYSFLVKVP